MNTIEEVIKGIIEAQEFLYFRTININDLNEQVGTKDVSQGIGVYSSLPSIKNTVFGATNNVLMEYDIEVYYLALNQNTDDTGLQVDSILDSLYLPASQFYDRIVQSGIVAGGQTVDSYTLDATETLKMTKEVLTGWRIQMTIPIWRSNLACPLSKTITTLIDSDEDILIDSDLIELIG